MINLNEAWAVAYRNYIAEEEKKFDENFDNLLDEMSEMTTSTINSLNILSEFYNAYDQMEALNEQEGAPAGTTVSSNDKNNKNNNQTSDNFTDSIGKLLKTYSDTIFNSIYKKNDDDAYTPKPIEIVTPISQMKFPQNIIFFISTIIKWIKNVVLYFLAKFSNILRVLMGDAPKLMDKNFLKLRFEKAKKLETTGDIKTAMAGNANIRLFSLDKNGEMKSIMTEGLFDGIFVPEKKQTQNVVVSIDLSKDMIGLKEYIQHFYNLFDNAYGSNNEKLFESEDLELILDIFKKTLSDLKDGTISRYAINGNAIEFQPISVDKVKESHNVTAQNVLALKTAYMSTSQKIKDIAKIINSKELLAMSDLGVSYTLLSAATYSQMAEIYKTTLERLKSAKDLEKTMIKVQKNYQDLVDELNKMQKFSMTLSNISYDVVYNRRMQLLLTAAKYMSNVVSMRLTALAIYIKELREIQGVIKMLVDINNNKK